ncbi:AraC family transcriptional regulator [Paenibacillus sp. TRM 82003]|nr:AraC family transcriptional regulator [Paenibacillus sp. TRM 82003]
MNIIIIRLAKGELPLVQQFSNLSIRNLCIEEITVSENSQLQLTIRDAYSFVYILQEHVKVLLRYQDKSLSGKVPAGDLFVVPPKFECRIQSPASRPIRLFIFQFQCFREDHSVVDPQPFNLFDTSTYNFISFKMLRVRDWISDFSTIQDHPSMALNARMHSCVYAMVSELLQIMEQQERKPLTLMDYVKHMKRHMIAHYNKQLEIEDIAKLSGAGSGRFYEAFRQYSGLSPYKYITKLRLDSALPLLVDSTPVHEVTRTLGYSDSYYFSRLFKKHMGLPPTEYSTRAAIKIAVLSPVFNGDLAILGITPTISIDKGWLYSEHRWAEVLETVLKAKPDLILSGPLPEALRLRFTEVASVFAYPWKEHSWRTRLKDLAELLHLESVAERWLSYYDMKIENAALHVHKRFGGRQVLLLGIRHRSILLFGMKVQKIRDLYYDELGLAAPPSVGSIGRLRVDSIDELASMDCPCALVIAESNVSEAFCNELKEQWMLLNPEHKEDSFVIIRHRDPFRYNAAIREELLEETVYTFFNDQDPAYK